MADKDPLTRLWNRGAFDADIVARVRDAQDSPRPLSIVLLDVDKFKSINDEHGHQRGDAVLVATAQRLQGSTEGKGEAYRYGGDEFVIILPNHTTSEAVAVAERLRREFESIPIEGNTVTVSLGISTFPTHASTSEQLFANADTALYDAKNRGRNVVRVFGEPAPAAGKEREPDRKEPPIGGLTEAEKGQVRSEYFTTHIARCPKDGAILVIHRRNRSIVRPPFCMCIVRCAA